MESFYRSVGIGSENGPMIIVLCNIERKERNWSKRRREYRVLRLQGVTTFPAFSRRSSSAGLEILLNQYPNWPKRLVCKRAWTRTYAVSRNIQASVETLAGIERYAISRVLLPCSFVYLHNSRWWPVIKTHTPRRVCTSPSFLSSPSVASIQYDVTFFYITKLHFQSLLTAFHLAPRNFKLYAPVSLYIVKILSLYIYVPEYETFFAMSILLHVWQRMRNSMDSIIIANEIAINSSWNLFPGWLKIFFGNREICYFFFYCQFIFLNNNFSR